MHLIFNCVVIILSHTDIGNFPENFSLGFQLSAESGTGLLFYLFSRRREDKMAVQLHNSTVCCNTVRRDKYRETQLLANC